MKNELIVHTFLACVLCMGCSAENKPANTCTSQTCSPASDDAGLKDGAKPCTGCDAALEDGHASSVETGGCVPRTCVDLGFECGAADDGCGGQLDCGTCTACAQTCGGGGVPHRCGGPTCCPKTCKGLGYDCGSTSDGCGAMLDCGVCPTGQVCGAGGKPNVCGTSG